MRSPERGSGSVLAIALIGAVIAVTALVIPIYAVLSVKAAVAAAADASALAAADARVGAVTGYPCDRAAEVASANGARLAACGVDGLVATVTVERWLLGLRVAQTASAGPARG